MWCGGSHPPGINRPRNRIRIIRYHTNLHGMPAKQYYNTGNEEKEIRKFNVVRISRAERFYFVFQVIRQMPETPVAVFYEKIVQPVQGITGICGYSSFGIHCKHTFKMVPRQLIFVIIQKTTDVELVCPAQHLPFGLNKVINRKGTKSSFHNRKLVIIVVVIKAATIIEKAHVLKFIINAEIIVIATPSFSWSASG